MDTELLKQLETYRAYMFVMLRALSQDPQDYQHIQQAFYAFSVQDAALAKWLAERICQGKESKCSTIQTSQK